MVTTSARPLPELPPWPLLQFFVRRRSHNAPPEVVQRRIVTDVGQMNDVPLAAVGDDIQEDEDDDRPYIARLCADVKCQEADDEKEEGPRKPDDTLLDHIPTTYPGCRLPHVRSLGFLLDT